MRMNKLTWTLGTYWGILGLIASFNLTGVWALIACGLSAGLLFSMLWYMSDRMAQAYGKSDILWKDKHDR